MLFFNIILFLVALGVSMFVTLGFVSRRKSPPALTAEGRLPSLPGTPNCVSSESGTTDAKQVAPLATTDLDAVKAAIEACGGVIKSQTKTYLHAEFKSDFFGFVDDVQCRIDDGVTHVRSASRVGYSDRGVNRRRVGAIRAQLQNA